MLSEAFTQSIEPFSAKKYDDLKGSNNIRVVAEFLAKTVVIKK